MFSVGENVDIKTVHLFSIGSDAVLDYFMFVMPLSHRNTTFFFALEIKWGPSDIFHCQFIIITPEQ